ncbi:hypothetical protein GCM10017771_00490 [Streptomyces capitiformicae]|uniref:Uncharacterized protein n=1 Tax=Streptomyces capitiformicae TaxID=2014920 RepID=A0A919G9X5_9ACTN|nr:hypothetical protein GCM10017771_00490 [Streptomyces capitiformicae]
MTYYWEANKALLPAADFTQVPKVRHFIAPEHPDVHADAHQSAAADRDRARVARAVDPVRRKRAPPKRAPPRRAPPRRAPSERVSSTRDTIRLPVRACPWPGGQRAPFWLVRAVNVEGGRSPRVRADWFPMCFMSFA